MTSLEEQIKQKDFFGIMVASIITALAFVAGLFWRDAVKDTINIILPKGQGLMYEYIAAIVATAFVIFVGYILVKAKEKKDEAIQKLLKAKKKRK